MKPLINISLTLGLLATLVVANAGAQNRRQLSEPQDKPAFQLGTILRVPGQYPTIQAAIDASSNGDTILVSDGTYYESIRFQGRKIVVASTYLTTGDTSHIVNTIIDGSLIANPDSASVVYFISGEDTNSVLCGFTVCGGRGTKVVLSGDVWMMGGGVLSSHSGARLTRNIIRDNTISGTSCGGGGIRQHSNTGFTPPVFIIMEHNIVTRNTGAATTGRSEGAGISLSAANVILRENTITYNSATSVSGNGAGGGIGVMPGKDGMEVTYTFRDNTITNNSATSSTRQGVSGGILINGSGQTVRILDNIIADNTASTQATAWNAIGAILCQSVTATVEGNLIARNKTLAPNCTAYPAYGGGFSGWDVALTFQRNIVAENVVQNLSYTAYRGGMSVYASTSQNNVLISENVIASNSVISPSGYGGGIHVFDEKARVANNIIVKNTASYGGGIALRWYTPLGVEPPTLINNTITHNRATTGQGGGIVTRGSWTPRVINTIVWGDTATQEIALLNGGSIRILHSDIQGGWPSDSGNIDVNPLFVDATYRLSDPSICIGAGRDSLQIGGTWFRAPDQCIYGMARPSPAGSHPDLGACESPRANPLTDVLMSYNPKPTTASLAQNFPNPFNPSTTIRYGLPQRSRVTLTVFNTLGQQVAQLANGDMEAGYHDVRFDGGSLASGVYLYRLQAGTYTSTRKFILMK